MFNIFMVCHFLLLINDSLQTYSLLKFSLFVSFFPQLVAGPIERATHLLPQFYNKRNFEYTKAVDGMRQILWGLLKKCNSRQLC